jgi:hypothetical protein
VETGPRARPLLRIPGEPSCPARTPPTRSSRSGERWRAHRDGLNAPRAIKTDAWALHSTTPARNFVLHWSV